MKNMLGWLLVLTGFVPVNAGEAAPQVQASWAAEPNRLANPAFTATAPASTPTGWAFNDYSKQPGFGYTTAGGVFRLTTTGDLYGYLTQSDLPVEEGEIFYGEVWVKLNSRALLWMETRQHDDKLGALQPPKSSTKIYGVANPDHGEHLVAELRHFIEEAYLAPVGDTRWNRCAAEFTVPKGHGVTRYDFRIGAYGGRAGWIEIKDPYFAPARRTATVRVLGKGLVQATVIDATGETMGVFPLAPDADEQTFTVTAPRRLRRYEVELLDNQGVRTRSAL